MEIEELKRWTTFVCFDIETTGLNPSNAEIIEIGALKVRDGKVIQTFSEFIRPMNGVPKNITALTGIKDTMVQDAAPVDIVIRRFIDFVEEDILIGHNIMFDYSFIKTAANREHLHFEKKGIDTLELCRKLHKELESKSLESMCKHYNIINRHAHRAYDDAKATALLYVNLCNNFFGESPLVFKPKPLLYKVKKIQPITNRQKKTLIDLIKYHKIENILCNDTLTQNEASRLIDKINLEYGKMK